MIDVVTDSVGNADRFLHSAKQFAESFPEDPSAGDVQRLVTSRKPIDAVEAWIAVLKHPAYTAPEMADSKRSGEWIEILDRATALQADHPLAQQPLGWRVHYEAIARRAEMLSKVRGLLQSELLGQMYLYPDLKEGWFYSDVSPRGDSPTAHVVEYFADLSLNRQTKNFGSRFSEQVLPRVRLAGHSAYAIKAARSVASVSQGDFTPALYRVINELRALEVDVEIDPILKLDLMRRLLQIGVEGSEPLRFGFHDWRTALESSDFPWDANWMSPGDSDPQVSEARSEARSLLQSFGDWDGRVKRMSESFRRFREPRSKPPMWVGWVAGKEDGYVGLLRSDATAGELFVLASDQATGRSSLVEIGPLTNGSMLDIESTTAQVIGAPICVFPKLDPPPRGSAVSAPRGSS
jgi:hypothetical protein